MFGGGNVLVTRLVTRLPRQIHAADADACVFLGRQERRVNHETCVQAFAFKAKGLSYGLLFHLFRSISLMTF